MQSIKTAPSYIKSIITRLIVIYQHSYETLALDSHGPSCICCDIIQHVLLVLRAEITPSNLGEISASSILLKACKEQYVNAYFGLCTNVELKLVLRTAIVYY